MYSRRVPGLINVNDKILKRPYILQNPTLMWLKKDNDHSSEKTQNENRDWLHDSIPVWSRLNYRNSSGQYRQLTTSISKNYDIEIDGVLLSLWGNLHPNASPFPEERRGKQYLACCVMALCATHIYPVGEWSAEILDSILINGDRYYVQSISTQSSLSTESNALNNDITFPSTNLNSSTTTITTPTTTTPLTVTRNKKEKTTLVLTKDSTKETLKEANSPNTPASTTTIPSKTLNTNKSTTQSSHYQRIAISILKTNPTVLSGQFSIDNLNADCWLDSVHFCVHIEHVTDGKLYCLPNNYYSNLAEALMYFFSHFQMGLLECLKRCLAFGFLPGPSGGYFLYDCQSREFPLFGKNQGVTYTLLTKNLQMLLYCMVVTLNVYTLHETFSLYNVEIKSDFGTTISRTENKKNVTWKNNSEVCKKIKKSAK